MTDKTDPGSMTTRQLRARRRRLARSLPDAEGLIAGSVVEQGRRCGKEGCRCATGEAHGGGGGGGGGGKNPPPPGGGGARPSPPASPAWRGGETTPSRPPASMGWS